MAWHWQTKMVRAFSGGLRFQLVNVQCTYIYLCLQDGIIYNVINMYGPYLAEILKVTLYGVNLQTAMGRSGPASPIERYYYYFVECN